MNDTLRIMRPVKRVSIAGGSVDVKELSWPDALGFLQELSRHVGQFLTPDGRLSLPIERLPELIQQSATLLEYLVAKATDKDAAWLNGLTPVQAIEVLDAALELNLSPDLFARGKALAGRLQAVFDSKPAGVPLTSSSRNDAIS